VNEFLPSAADSARWTLAAQHPLTHQWCPDEKSRLARLAEDHEFDLQLATDLDLAAKRATLTPGHRPEELLNRWVAVSSTLSALLSMRFEGGDATKPFVDASVLSRPLMENDFSELSVAAMQIYGTFGPRYLRLWSSAPTDAFVGTDRDRRFGAAPVRDLVRGSGDTPAELSLTVTTDLAKWDDAAAAYAAVDADHPAHPDQARLQGADELQLSVEGGTLFDVVVDHEWAGWVGATAETTSSLGLSCYEVQEIILIPGFRERGYGSHLTTLLARELSDGDRVLLGTIHADNRGALASAKQAGRCDVGGWLKLSL